MNDKVPKPPDRFSETNTQPDDLVEERGFTGYEESTTDCVRWVWYEKHYACEQLYGANEPDSSIVLTVQVLYELHIGDDPMASVIDNFVYYYDRTRLLVSLRDDIRAVFRARHPSHEVARGIHDLFIGSRSELDKFCATLGRPQSRDELFDEES